MSALAWVSSAWNAISASVISGIGELETVVSGRCRWDASVYLTSRRLLLAGKQSMQWPDTPTEHSSMPAYHLGS